MKTKRYFNQILKPYKKIIKEIFGDYTTVRVVIGEKFCCYCRENYDLEIEIPIFEDILGHQAFFNKRLNQFKINEYFSNEILSFLHEIGHIKTYNKWNDFKYVIGTNLITRIQATYIFRNSLFLTNLCYKKYFNLKLEKNADYWAMKYIKNNTKKVVKWQNELAKNYQKILPKLIDKMDLEVM